MYDQDVPGHNRWHPEIPTGETVEPGEEVRMDCREWIDGQIKNTDDANDVRDVDLSRNHVLSGPIAVNSAEPGDVLVVDILDLGPHLPDSAPEGLAGAGWGYTGIFDRENGGGFLTDYFPDAHKAIWDFSGIYATSRHVPGVRFAGLSHPGLIGCAPSNELLAEWKRRERELIATNPDRTPPLALPSEPQNALLGMLVDSEKDRVAGEACRTVPPKGARLQRRHKEPLSVDQDLLPGICRGREALARGPALLAGGRGDHVLRRRPDERLD